MADREICGKTCTDVKKETLHLITIIKGQTCMMQPSVSMIIGRTHCLQRLTDAAPAAPL